ncbi:ankyrin repeat-containing domain protein [Morchella snyderi]|nr:ankyrin repeat-containing domain protein [Morchella snyderi]
MSLLSLPNELLLLIVESLTSARDLCCLVFTNRRFCHLFAPSLLRYAIQKEHAMTALFYAAAVGNRPLIRLILESGPPLMVLGHIRDRIGDFGIRVIYSAPMRCADEAVDRILSIGPGIQLTRLWEGRASPSAPLPALTHGTFHGTFPALHWGVLQGHYRLVRMLLARPGVDVNARIHISLNRWGYRDHDAYSQEADERGPNRRVYRRHFAPGEFNVAPLHLAAYLGHKEIVELLLHSGAEVGTLATYDNKTELHLAAQMGHEGVVRLLLEKGADVDMADGGGWHPLFGAVMFGHEAMVALLLDRGANTNLIGSGVFKQWSGRTLLHFLVLRDEIRPYRCWPEERKKILRLLLEAGADPTIPDRCGESVYILAQALGDDDLVKALSENYLWYGVRYWESRSRGALRRERQRLYMGWKLRRWCKDRQDVALRGYKKTCSFLCCVWL